MDEQHEFSYNEKRYLGNLIRFAKSLIIKSEYDAKKYEDPNGSREIFLYLLICEKKDTVHNYVLTGVDMAYYRQQQIISASELEMFNTEPSKFYEFLASIAGKGLSAVLTRLKREEFLATYVEKNKYYLNLNGEPHGPYEYVMVYHSPDYKQTYVEGLLNTRPLWTYATGVNTVYLHEINEITTPDMFKVLASENYTLLKQIYDKFEYEYIMRIFDKVPYYNARSAENLTVLYYDEGIVSDADTKTFFKNYYKVLDYIQHIGYNRDLGDTELYDKFITLVLTLITVSYTIADKFNNIITRNFVTSEEQKDFLKDYGLHDLVDILPKNYIKTLIANIDELIEYKGTEQVMIRILEMFKISDIEIYKYAMLRTPEVYDISRLPNVSEHRLPENNYKVSFVKLPINANYKVASENSYFANSLNHMPVEKIAIGDPYWGINGKTNDLESKKEYIRDMETEFKKNSTYSYLYTKYIGTMINVDIVKTLINASYLINSILQCASVTELKVRYSTNAEPCRIRDLFAAIFYATWKRFPEMDDTIPTNPAAISAYMGFNTHPTLDELKELDTHTLTLDGQTQVVKLESTLSPVDLSNNYILIRSMRSVEGVDPDVIVSNFKKDYKINIEKYHTLQEKIRNPDNSYDEYMKYKTIFDYNMYSQSILDVFLGYPSLTDYLSAEAPDVFDYINNTLDAIPLYEEVDNSTNVSEAYRAASMNMVEEFIGIITDLFAENDETKDALTLVFKDNAGLFSNIFHILNKFKSYTVDLSSSNNSYIMEIKDETVLRTLDYLAEKESGWDPVDTVEYTTYDKLQTINSFFDGISKFKVKDELVSGVTFKLDTYIRNINSEGFPDPSNTNTETLMSDGIRDDETVMWVKEDCGLIVDDYLEDVTTAAYLEDRTNIKDETPEGLL